MPATAIFSLDAFEPPFAQDLTVIANDDNPVPIIVVGFDPADVVVQMAFTAKVSTADADNAPTAVQKLIVTNATSAGQIVSMSATAYLANFQLHAADASKFSTTHQYDVKVWIRRAGVLSIRTVQRGQITAVPGVTGRTSLAAATVTVTPSPAVVFVGSTTQLTATVRDALGNTLADAPVSWSSSDPTLATVDPSTGLVTGVAAGTPVITATADSATAQVSVTSEIDPSTPAGMVAQFNALGANGVGATFRSLLIIGLNQTVKANGDVTLPSPATNSPTGYWLTKWDDAIAPNQGKHKQPSLDVNGGNGAPCVPVNTANLALGGREAGQGLEWPASTGYSAGTQETISRSVFLPNSGGLSNVLTDHTAGFMLFAFGHMKNGTYPFYIGEVGDAAKTYYSGDFGFGKEALVDPLSGYVDGLFSTTPTKQLMAIWCATINGRSGALWSQDWYYVGRDLLWYDSAINVNDGTYGPTPGANITGNAAATRRIRTNKDGGNIADQYGAHYCEGAIAGRWTAAQHKLLVDWCKLQSWGSDMWEDTRQHLTYYFGDSLFIESDRNLSRGSNGAPAIPSHTIIFLAQSGDFLEQRLYHLVELFRDLDFANRAPTAGVCMCAAGEWVNDIVSDGNPTNCVTRNYFQGDALRALDPQRIRVIMSGETYSGATTITNGQTMLNILLNGNGGALSAAVPAHADVYLDYVDLLPFTPYHFQDGQPAHQIPVFFDGSSHWTALAEEYLEAPVRNAILAAYGIDDSGYSNDVVPLPTNANLSAGTPTVTPTWTVKNRVRQTLLGRTLTFTSLDPAIATVDAVSGQVTRVAAGRARIKALVNNDNGAGEGIFVADCT